MTGIDVAAWLIFFCVVSMLGFLSVVGVMGIVWFVAGIISGLRALWRAK